MTKFNAGDMVRISEEGHRKIHDLLGFYMFPFDTEGEIQMIRKEKDDSYWYLCDIMSFEGFIGFWLEEDWLEKVIK